VDFASASIRDSFWLIVPEVALITAGCLFFLGAGFSRFRRYFWAEQALAVIVIAICVCLATSGSRGMVLAEDGDKASLFRNDDFTLFAKLLSLFAGGILVMLSRSQVGGRQEAEYYGCLLFIIAGVDLVAAANDLVSLFLALELISIPTYVLLYLPQHDPAVQEATTKYFLLSIFSSALFLYGLSFLYGVVGSTNLAVLRTTLAQNADLGSAAGLVGVAIVMIVAGLGFRITAAPFHFYAPDVYQGVPAACAALLSLVPKVAGFIALYSVVTATVLVHGPDVTLGGHVSALFWIVALVSMFVGNLLGLWQNNIKRLLAYSGVAHAGYMLIGLGAGNAAGAEFNGITALFFYLVIYGAMTVGAFAVPIYLSQPDRPVETVDDLSGLWRSHPSVAVMMALFMFSLTGLPPTAGFWGKLGLFFAAWSAQTPLYRLLAVLMAINAAIGAYFYLRIVSVMYLRQPVKTLAPSQERTAYLGMLACAAVVVGIFISPGSLWRAVEHATTPAPAQRPMAQVAMEQ
jgi:NADH-quinone oxidoreductase subunit N